MKTRVYVGIWESTIKTTINKHLIKFIFGSVLICPKLLYNRTWRAEIISSCSLENFEDTKGIIKNRDSKTDRQHNDQMEKTQKGKQWSTKHYTEN